MSSDRTVRLDDRLTASSNVHCREFDGELVILDLESGQYFALDGAGVRIWEALAAGKSLAEVAQDVAGEYDVPESAAATDCLHLAQDLVDRGLLLRREGSTRGDL